MNIALFAYVADSNDKRPKLEPPGGAAWAWDLPMSAGDARLSSGCQKKIFYCPSTAPKFTDSQNFANPGNGKNLWDFNMDPNGGYHVMGCILALSGSLRKIHPTNQDTTLNAETITYGGQTYVVGPSERVVTADAIISASAALPGCSHPENNYTDVAGGFKQNGAEYTHLSPHLKEG
jgi:hypothetical protein